MSAYLMFLHALKERLLSPPSLLRRLLVLLWVSIFVTVGLASPLHPLAKKHEVALRTIANYLAPGHDNAGLMLSDLGYHHPNDQAWQNYSAFQKIQAGYLAAVHANPQHGGEIFLAATTHQLRARYQSIGQQPWLAQYFTGPRFANPPPPTFNIPPPDTPKVTIPIGHINAIVTLAKYSEGNALGGIEGILTDYFGLTELDAYNIMNSEHSVADMLIAGMSRVYPARRDDVMSDVVQDLDRKYQGARSEVTLEPFRRKRETPIAMREPPTEPFDKGDFPPDEGPPKPFTGPNDSPPGGGSWTGNTAPSHDDRMNARYNNFSSKEYPGTSGGGSSFGGGGGSFGGGGGGGSFGGGGGGLSFSEVISVPEGFGGVVFGNTVDGDSTPGKLQSIHWIPNLFQNNSASKEKKGRIVMLFQRRSGGSIVTTQCSYSPVMQGDVFAAQQILLSKLSAEGQSRRGKLANDQAWKKAAFVGLVGIDHQGTENYDLYFKKHGKSESGIYWRVVMNPAVLNSDLGYSVLMSDVIPTVPDLLKRQVTANCSSIGARRVKTWLNYWFGDVKSPVDYDRSHSIVTWKFTDAPLHIAFDGSQVIVERKQAMHTYPLGLRRTAFLDVKGFVENPDPLSEKYAVIAPPQFAEQFVENLPYLMKASRDYERLNNFAAVYALLRWAKQNGAILGDPNPIPRPPRVSTPESLVITEKTFLVPSGYVRRSSL